MSYTVSDFEIIALSLISLCFETPDMRLGKEVQSFCCCGSICAVLLEAQWLFQSLSH